MATYHERADLAAGLVFQQRCRQALEKYVLYQLGTGALTGNQLSLAKDIIGAPDTWAARAAIAVSTEDAFGSNSADDPAVDSDTGDAKLQYSIEARVWPALSAEAPA